MTSKLKLVGFIVCATVLSATQARATTYTYTGNNFQASEITDNTPPAGTYTTSESVSGSFTVPTPLAGNFSGFISPTSFSFFDGRNTITNSNANLTSSFNVTTNASGAIVQWAVFVQITPLPLVVGSLIDMIATAFEIGLNPTDQASITFCAVLPCPTGSGSQKDFAANFGTPGVWSSNATAVPLPTALPLFATGLAGLGLLGWRRKKKAAP